jgi:hypothetical protein
VFVFIKLVSGKATKPLVYGGQIETQKSWRSESLQVINIRGQYPESVLICRSRADVDPV